MNTDKPKTMSPETKAKLSASMKKFYADNPDRKPGGKKKRRSRNTREIPLSDIPDTPLLEKPKRKRAYNKRIEVKGNNVDTELKLAIVTLLNKLL